MKSHNSFEERFEFTGSAKTLSLVAIALGVIGILYGFLYNHGEYAERTFSNLLLMGYYFVCVCIGGVFFCAYQYAAQAGWSASMLRVPQAFAKLLPVASIILIIIISFGLFTSHPVVDEETGKTVVGPYLYAHWATNGLTTPGNPIYNKVIAGKAPFLNIKFFYGMLIVLLGAYSIFAKKLVDYSVNEDEAGGMINYKKSFKTAIIFLVVFGFTFPIFAFGTIMSIEAHWFSTMFGWYNLAAMHVVGLATITLTLLFVQKKGNMEWFNTSQLHSLGKLMFGFSVFWTYVWFAQFFLTWYANMPEESVYFFKRWQPEYKFWFWLNIVLNFVAPLLLLMSRDAKRLKTRMMLVCCVLIIGHWLDYYLMIMPGTVGTKREFGAVELFTFIGFAGLFVFLMLTTLSKFKSLIPKKHPFLEESLHFHI